MIKIQDFVKAMNSDFFVGVPDSRLKELCGFLISEYGSNSKNHMIAANEGNAVGIAAGYHLATGKTPVVYMQNSGQGNVINPITSLLDRRVYGIPVIFIVGWRGEPGVKDEPQHIFQGEITKELFDVVDIPVSIVDKNTSIEDLSRTMDDFNKYLNDGRSVAILVKDGSFESDTVMKYKNCYDMTRESIIEIITDVSGDDPIISTTGKTSRELFEIRANAGVGHGRDFLTVGSMGHSSSIALGVAMNKPEKTVWCIDGDGAVLMHMGGMAVIGASYADNFVHILINNEAHESVGGMPNASENVDYCEVAKACGYKSVCRVDDKATLKEILLSAKKTHTLTFIEIKAAIGARKDLGRPTTSPIENKEAFMSHIDK